MYAARFDTLLGHQAELSERRRRLMSSALMAATLSLAAGTFAWVGDAMGITAVAPPSNAYQVTLSLFEAPPPPTPPPAPAAAAAAADDGSTPSEPEVEDPDPDPAPVELEPLLDPRPAAPRRAPTSASGPGTGSGSNPFGGTSPAGIGTGTCVLPPCIGTGTGDPRPWNPRPTPTEAGPQKVPLDAAMARAISTPDPDQTALARTKTGQTLRRGGRSTVSFCIDERGRTFDVKTRRAFGNDPEIDRICRNAVSRWRFAPMKVGGRARTTCTSTTFEIHFD